jgi:hypothetical protein
LVLLICGICGFSLVFGFEINGWNALRTRGAGRAGARPYR